MSLPPRTCGSSSATTRAGRQPDRHKGATGVLEAVIVVLLIGAWSMYGLVTGRSKRTVLDQWVGVFLGLAMLVWLLILAAIVSSE